jgi:hypothetical protein
MHATFLSESLKVADHLEDIGKDGDNIKTYLKDTIVKLWTGFVGTISGPVAVTNFRVQEGLAGNFLNS